MDNLPPPISINRIVWTNGCFDLIGPHHVYCLQKAKALGKWLIVGVNDDESVRRLKGHGRPIIPLEHRMAILAALECVDLVVPFSEDTPVEILKKLRPDVLVKGYSTNRNRVGDEFAGSVHLVPVLEGWSTTATIERIKGIAI